MTRQRQLLLVVGAVAVVAIIVGVVMTRSDESLVGSERRVTLSWQCWNAIDWEDENGGRWWAGSDPVRIGTLETEPSIDAPNFPRRRVAGTLRIESTSRATFTSDAGGTLRLQRDRSESKTLECRLGP